MPLSRPKPVPLQGSGYATPESNGTRRSGTGSRDAASMTEPFVYTLGFTVLYEPDHRDDNNTIADIVFIHGFQGHPQLTWTSKAKTASSARGSPSDYSRHSSSSHTLRRISSTLSNVYWPFHLLPSDQRNVRIMTYGYDSKITKRFRGPSNQMTLEDHGNSFLNSLEAQRRSCTGRPIIFVAHSLGGLLVKEAVCRSRFMSHDDLRDVYDSLHSVIFLGTPHKGSKDAKWGMLCRNIATAAGADANSALLRDLDPDKGGKKLKELDTSFREVLYEKGIKVSSFQESMGKAGTAFLNGKVVPNESSAFHDDEIEYRDSINANHMEMCRFAGLGDAEYIKVRDAIARHIKTIKKPRVEEFSIKEPEVKKKKSRWRYLCF